MRVSVHAQSYICLPCQIRTGRQVIVTDSLRLTSYSRRPFSSSKDEPDLESTHQYPPLSSQVVEVDPAPNLEIIQEKDTKSVDEVAGNVRAIPKSPLRRVASRARFQSPPLVSTENNSRGNPRNFATSSRATLKLSKAQQEELREANVLKKRLSEGLSSVEAIRRNPAIGEGIPIDQLLKTIPQHGHSPIQQKIIHQLKTQFSGQPYGTVIRELDLITAHGDPARRTVTDPKVEVVMAKLGIVESSSGSAGEFQPFAENGPASSIGSPTRRRTPLASFIAQQTPEKRRDATPGNRRKAVSAPWTKANIQTVEAEQLDLKSLDVGDKIDLPQLSFGLSRVLFNPGCVYQLQDPRSRVYNFDPYLEKIMPIQEFNFEALNPYLTSSEDQRLIKLAQAHGKRYIGSSSSMTSALSHFHFLISQWRDLNVNSLSRTFIDPNRSFTQLGKSPAAIFLRYRDGVYAVDADKEYDEPNMLMSLGKSMEKLLTLEKEDFEKWRRKNANSDGEPLEEKPESFHYSEQGRFLLRSQLDAHDPRLPGNGYFDLKTRAVAAIRFNIRDTEAGLGYEIYGRHGNWETYEREYYDMMRSAFLKYSLQARMGHMDGIFVAYHNTMRIFGFQYIPMPEMDFALHGQTDPCLGDQEFRLSIGLMEELFNQGTQKYPKQSLRIHFDTREASATEERPFMNIFIEPMTEDDIKDIQTSQKAQFEAFEQKMLRGEDPTPMLEAEVEAENADNGDKREGNTGQNAALPINTIEDPPTTPASNAADAPYLDKMLNSPRARVKPSSFEKEVMAFKLTVQNKINDRPVSRVEDINSAARWSLDYRLDRRSDEEGKKMYIQCKNRRWTSLRTVINRSSDDPYIRSMRAMSERGAEWRKQQDELDAQREKVVYKDRVK